MDQPARHTVRLVERNSLTPRVQRMVFRCMDSTPPLWLPGNHAAFEVSTDGDVELKYFSIASAPDPTRPGQLELAVGVESDSSLPFHTLPIGTDLTMRQPSGRFIRQGGDPRPSLLIGAGTGIAPLRAMVQAELRSDGKAPLVLLAGFRNDEDVLFGSELSELARVHPRFVFLTTMSRPAPSWTGLRGYVQDHVESWIARLARPAIFICGEPTMVASVEARISELAPDIDSFNSECYP